MSPLTYVIGRCAKRYARRQFSVNTAHSHSRIDGTPLQQCVTSTLDNSPFALSCPAQYCTSHGPAIDPSTMERKISEQKLSAARAYLRMRFPALADAPLLESRVCQYENSTERNFILDRHPEAANVWLVGGGSGHGFKHGPYR